jgi:hypothetical protein
MNIAIFLHGTWLYFLQTAPYIVGFFMPLFVELINKDVPGDKERFVVSALVCFVTACLIDWNKFSSGDVTSVLTWWGIVFSESYTIFKLYFQKSALRLNIQTAIKATPKIT